MNGNHRRALTAYLNDVEKDIERIRAELQAASNAGSSATHSTERNMSEGAAAAVADGVLRIENEVRSMMKTYNLSPVAESSIRNIKGALLCIRTTLYDLEPDRLQGFGPLAQKDRDSLNTHISKMRKVLDVLDRSI